MSGVLLSTCTDHHWYGMILTYRAKLVVDLAVPDCWEHTRVNKAEGIPLGCSLCLEVPPEPPLRLRLVRRDLRFDIAPSVVLVRLRPLADVVLKVAFADERASGQGAVVASAASVTVKITSTISHSSSPLAHES
jgi:hypothetical protein